MVELDADSYRYLTERLAAIPAIARTEVVVDDLIKRHGAVMRHRLAPERPSGQGVAIAANTAPKAALSAS